MSRMNLCLLVAAICVAGFAGVFYPNSAFGMNWFGKEEIKEPLNSFTYSSGGGMLGGHKSLDVKKVDASSAIVIDYDAEWHHAIPKVSEYKVSSKVLADIQKIFNAKEMAKWQNLPPSEIQILDGDTSSYYFNFGKRRVRFSDTQSLPNKWWESAKEIDSIIYKYCQQGEKLPGLVVPPRKEEEAYARPADGKVSLSLYYYQNNYLSFYVNNGTEAQQQVNCSYNITQISPEHREIVNKLEEDAVELEPHYAHETGIRLRDRLGTGRYMLKFGPYSIEFEMK